ncbi:MAG: bifunctional DNA-formamidopyrimidine glycosylase/DNA-(apurinic or apyrimidinic site) lyase [Pseudomonadota bacterium]|nr:bifunctional DNA-formamidopyrimidine glycosylase/DNA-(apurinic or apyrimidinic site) lyase [Pseudomonadota bacterium]
MPELPEVETTRRGIEPWLLGEKVTGVVVREGRLRWPVAAELAAMLGGQRVKAVERRGKYLLLRTEAGTLIIHLGMSGSLRIVPPESEPRRHDHVDIVLRKNVLRYHDPRRFGCLLWTAEAPGKHPLLRNLGAEPLEPEFGGGLLHALSCKRRGAVKNFIMDGKVVVGVGNIYASEALFAAGIHPARAACRISRHRYAGLAEAIREVLQRAIDAGGTTLRDFVGAEGDAGYFSRELLVYGREGAPCVTCGDSIRKRIIGQRSSFYCPRCQH